MDVSCETLALLKFLRIISEFCRATASLRCNEFEANKRLVSFPVSATLGANRVTMEPIVQSVVASAVLVSV